MILSSLVWKETSNFGDDNANFYIRCAAAFDLLLMSLLDFFILKVLKSSTFMDYREFHKALNFPVQTVCAKRAYQFKPY